MNKNLFLSKLAILFVVLSFVCCKKKEVVPPNEQRLTISDSIRIYNDSIERYKKDLVAQWKLDSLGCMKLRNGSLATEIIKEYHLIGKTEEKVIDVLGKPNIVFDHDNKHREFIYYLESSCNDAGRYTGWMLSLSIEDGKLKREPGFNIE